MTEYKEKSYEHGDGEKIKGRRRRREEKSWEKNKRKKKIKK